MIHNFFLTFRTYGTWLHGDERGWVDARHNTFGEPVPASDEALQKFRRELMKQDPVLFCDEARECVENTIDEVAAYRKWNLHARNARTNHVHIAVSGFASGEKMMADFKAYATRNLRAKGFFDQDKIIWAEHGSTPYFDSEAELLRIYNYIVFGQDHQR